jgi:hypothetical protein
MSKTKTNFYPNDGYCLMGTVIYPFKKGRLKKTKNRPQNAGGFYPTNLTTTIFLPT